MRTRTTDQITLFLIRHGATEGNAGRRYIGRTDEPLSEAGRDDLREKKRAGWYPPADVAAASPMLRCRETAELLYGRAPSVLVEEWKEIDFGRFEGKNYEDLKGDADYQAWIDSNGTLPFPEGEGREAFQNRCVSGFQRFCGTLPGGTSAALIVHGGMIMAVLAALTGEDYFSFSCKNGEGYRCRLERTGTGVRLSELRSLEELRNETNKGEPSCCAVIS